MKAGPHKVAAVPKLQDLLQHEYLELTIIDRQTELDDPDAARMMKVRNVRPVGYSTSIDARQAETITVNFVGIKVDDEDTTNAETPGASQLP
jgi:hypothetical protein